MAAPFPASFLNSLEKALAHRRAQGQLLHLNPPASELRLIDFGSNDSLNLRSSKFLHNAYVAQFSRLSNEDAFIGAGGSRIVDGSHRPVTELEADLARYHGAESALLFNSGYEANVAIYGTIPQKGDVIVTDEMIHASIRDGIKSGRAKRVLAFKHNNPTSLRAVLEDLIAESENIRTGRQMVFIALESAYSMEGDVSPLGAIITVAKQALPEKNVVVIIDEAHSTGLLGPGGCGYTSELGLQGEAVIQMHSYAKAPGAMGAVVLGPSIMKDFLSNYARSLMYSTGPTLPTVAAIRASMNVLRSAERDLRRTTLRSNMRFFHSTLATHAKWKQVQKRDILKIPTSTDPYHDHIPVVPIFTAEGRSFELKEYLAQKGFRTHAFTSPVVPVSEERIRLMMHVERTADEISALVDALMEWGAQKV
ncbi:pyridoxal phosphate-dependent transferase [Aspergillus karnatakaensis]|uniref:aminotransferase class I/II-fold pyridoxal phosphate-dependent enzyme n=1 Tax=Aspergillus karnatakaensis TaxID=1810916 RepID=UPI003CCCD201